MRIAHIIDNLNLLGGAQKMTLLFAQLATQNGIDFTVVSLEDKRPNITLKTELEKTGARVVVFSAKTLLATGRLARLVQFLRREKFDVIHTNLTYANIVGTTAGRLANTPVIAGLRNTKTQSSRYHQLRFTLESLTLRHLAGALMAVGQATAAAHQPRFNRKSIHVVPNAITLPPLPSAAERAALRAGLLANPTRPLLVAVGRLTEQKGYADLLEAVALVKRSHPAVALVIAGEGELRPELTAHIERLGLADHARLLGARNDVPALLAAGDIFVSSSRWEGLSNAILEAMAAGLPVVATRVNDTPHVLVEGTGLLVPPGDPAALAKALTQLLDQPARRELLGSAARAHVAHCHAPAAWFNQLMQLYQSVQTGPARPVAAGYRTGRPVTED